MRLFVVLFLSMGVLGCAQVPKESVELSATVGRDIGEIERSHRALVRLYYDRMESSVDRFVDNVYAPYAIEQSLKDPQVGGELAKAIAESSKPGSSAQAKKDTLEALGYYFEATRANIEAFRARYKAPLLKQRAELVDRLEVAYTRVKEGNTVVTGYLASVVKVTDEQNKLLAEAGFPDIRTSVAQKSDALARQLDDLVKATGSGRQKLAAAVDDGERVLQGLDK